MDFPDGALRSIEPIVPVLFDAMRCLGPHSNFEEESTLMGLPPFSGLECGGASAGAGRASSSRG